MGIIYILENMTDNKKYVGQTIVSFYKRFRQHQTSHSLIGKVLRKYGQDNFKITLIENVLNEKLDEVEKEFIEKYDTLYPNGYNLLKGPFINSSGNERRSKISYSRKGIPAWSKGLTKDNNESLKKVSENSKGENNPFYGKHHIEESIQKNREAHLGKSSPRLGKCHTEESKKLMSEAAKGRVSPMKGKSHTEEAKEKNRIAHLGNNPSNKGTRQERLCICGKIVKQKFSNGKFKGYQKTCGDKKCLDAIAIKNLKIA